MLALKPEKVRLCAPGLGSGIMHAYIAKERGYFAQEGLDLDVLVARGQICTMALLNGQMELSSNPNIFDAMVAGRFKGKVIYVSAKTLGHRFIVAPEIKSFDGLKQKNIAVSTFGGLTDMLTREILEQHGINPAKNVVLLQIGTPDVRYASLKAGTVRAALLASTQGLQAVKEGFRELPYHQPPWLSSPIEPATSSWPGPLDVHRCGQSRKVVTSITAKMARRRSLSSKGAAHRTARDRQANL